jgi:uncharacterized membrane protein YcaP (DUF421 family)
VILPPASIVGDLLDPGEPPWAKVIRTVAIYAFLAIALRVVGKREMGQLSTVDFAALLLLANTLQNAIIGDDISLTGGILGAVILLVVDNLTVRLFVRYPKLGQFLEGDPSILIQDGQVQARELRRQHITRAQLQAACRHQGTMRIEDVDQAILELDGTISVFPRHPTPDEVAYAEVQQRLAAIEQRLVGDRNAT